jgi:hypothetical protein
MSKGSISKKEIPTPEKGIRNKEKEEDCQLHLLDLIWNRLTCRDDESRCLLSGHIFINHILVRKRVKSFTSNCNTSFHNRFHNGPPLVPLLSQMNLFHSLPSYFCETKTNIMEEL